MGQDCRELGKGIVKVTFNSPFLNLKGPISKHDGMLLLYLFGYACIYVQYISIINLSFTR